MNASFMKGRFTALPTGDIFHYLWNRRGSKHQNHYGCNNMKKENDEMDLKGSQLIDMYSLLEWWSY